MTLGILYHMPFWRDDDGRLREVEGSFARYVDSLAPYFDEISLCVPVIDKPRGEGTAIRATNVTLSPLPPFDGPVHFYPRLAIVLPRLFAWVRGIDLLHCRVPTPAAIFAFTAARVLRRPVFLLVVGDLRALLPTMPYRGVKRLLWRLYTEWEERGLASMTHRGLTFANGPALAAKHSRAGSHVIETKTTTISEHDIAKRHDTCASPLLRILTVSRIDPRKGLRALPPTVRSLKDGGIEAAVDIVGPAVGQPGEGEQRAIIEAAHRLGVGEQVRCLGPMPLDRLLPAYADYDLFVLPTLPGEGIPRVLLEAMASGLPIVTTRVAGIPGLITNGSNGLLIDEPTPTAIADAIRRVVSEPALRRTLIANGYVTARRYTLEAQAASMMAAVAEQLHVRLRPAVATVA